MGRLANNWNAPVAVGYHNALVYALDALVAESMTDRYKWMGGTSGGMSKHRKAGHPPGNLHAVAELLTRESDARAARRKRRGGMFSSVRALMAARRKDLR